MWANPIFLVGAGIAFIVGAAAAAAFHRYRYQQQYNYEYREPSIPQFDRRVLGPCGICNGDASVVDSYQAQCGHYIHYTCAANVNQASNSRSPIDNRQLCLACIEQREQNNSQQQINPGLRNRASNVRECANCLIRITNEEPNIREMTCGHPVHELCWERMQNSASTTCPACMQG